MTRRISIALLLPLAALIAAANGCGDSDGLGKRYPVSGTVTYKGEPLKKGKINFIPEKADDPPGGANIEDGQIKNVMTLSPNDGLLPGKYKVTISASADFDYEGATKKYSGAVDPVEVAKAQKKAGNLVPTKYANAIDSGLTAEVTSGSNSFKFDLVGEPEAPGTEPKAAAPSGGGKPGMGRRNR